MTAAATVFGAGLFAWVTIGDLSPHFKDAAGLPDALKAIGPPMFVLGFVVTLYIAGRAAVAPRRTAWIAMAGFAIIVADLDVLPLAAIALLGALSTPSPLPAADQTTPGARRSAVGSTAILHAAVAHRAGRQAYGISLARTAPSSSSTPPCAVMPEKPTAAAIA